MNWEAIGAIGEIVGAIAVVCSLVYLGYQMRQNSLSIRSQSLNAQAEQIHNYLGLHTNPELLDAIEIAYSNPDAELSFKEACLVETYIGTALALFQNQFKQNELGMESDWNEFRFWLNSTFTPKFAKTWWKEHGRQHYNPDFGKEVDKAIELLEKNPSTDYWANYNMQSGDMRNEQLQD